MSKKKPPEWAEWFSNNTAQVAAWMFVVWLLFGFFVPLVLPKFVPSEKIAVSGQIGDMFGLVNSLFSGLAFVAAITAVLLQTIEMRESGERRLEEEKQQTEQMKIAKDGHEFQVKMQNDQDKMQLRQLKIAKDTAFLQSLMLRETQRNTMNQILSEVTEASHVLYKEILIYHRRQILAKQTGGGIEHEQLRSALAELLMVNAKVAGLRTSIITTFAAAGEDLVKSLHGWLELVGAITKRDGAGTPTVNVMQDAELEAKLQGKLKDTLDGIGKVFESDIYKGLHYIYNPDEDVES
ncbi:MAG: hypothetical protein V4719_18310 [Planctomycetota bacterium]